MRKNFGTNPYFFPLPVLIVGSYDGDGNANAMNAAWGGLYDADQVILCLSGSQDHPEHPQKRRVYRQLRYTAADEALRLCGPCLRQQHAGQDGKGGLYHEKE